MNTVFIVFEGDIPMIWIDERRNNEWDTAWLYCEENDVPTLWATRMAAEITIKDFPTPGMFGKTEIIECGVRQ